MPISSSEKPASRLYIPLAETMRVV